MRFYQCISISFLLMQLSYAGMPSVTLTDVAEMRLQSLSFFIFAYLLMALFVKWLWNYLAKSFTNLPTLNYARSLALSLISGLFLYIILTMVSGARELLTPGAWKKQGTTYKLSQPTLQPSPDREIEVSQLKKLIWEYKDANDGKFPPNLYIPSIRETGIQLNFAYLPPAPNASSHSLVVYEINTASKNRHVILFDGTVKKWDVNYLKQEFFKNE